MRRGFGALPAIKPVIQSPLRSPVHFPSWEHMWNSHFQTRKVPEVNNIPPCLIQLTSLALHPECVSQSYGPDDPGCIVTCKLSKVRNESCGRITNASPQLRARGTAP